MVDKEKEASPMKRYNLAKVQQNGKEFYMLVADPRTIVKLLVNYKSGEEQDTQRPWEEKRVREIARYVSGKFKDDENKQATGLIPNAPILNVKGKIKLEEDAQGPFIMLPETASELATFEGTIEAIDGQHRIRAFMEEYIDVDFAPNTVYDMIFSVFFQLSKKDKKEIFMITNEKQVKVPGNLLRMYKRELDLLKGDEVVYDLVCLLNSEDYSPIKNRVMIGSKKIKKGYQESQISKILNKSETYRQLEALVEDDHNKMARIISNYLTAWEQVYGVSYQDPGKETLTKISGLRYVFFLFPAMLDILLQRQKAASIAEFKKIIEMLPDAVEVEDVFTDPSTSHAYKGEGATITLAKHHITKLKAYEQKHKSSFNIAEGI